MYRDNRTSPTLNQKLPPRSRTRKHQPRMFDQNKIWIWTGSAMILFFLTITLSITFISAQTIPLDKVGKVDFSSVIYDQQNNVISKIGAQRNEYISMKQIMKLNPMLPKAFVKVEDERFYEHSGVDYWGFLRAIWKNILAFGKSEGASTITMQVARNVVLEDRQKSYFRKLKEIKVASSLEEEFGKDKILETYLNYISFGNQVKGIQMAAKIYFGKDLTKNRLDPQEIALLAGLPKAPYGYDPYGTDEQKHKSLLRRNVVLAKMAEDSTLPPLISQQEKERLQKTSLGVNPKFLKQYTRTSSFSAYQNLVRKEITERYDLTETELENEGYRIITGINAPLQLNIENTMKNKSLFTTPEQTVMLNGGIILIHPQSGLIRAIVGGKEYKTGDINWALKKMQPGTSLRPLTLYAPTIAYRGMNEKTILSNKKMLGDAIVNQEIDPIKTLMLTSDRLYDRVNLTNKKLGIIFPSDSEKRELWLGNNIVMNAKQLAEAYTVFPNYGKRSSVHAVIAVYDKAGNIIHPKKNQSINASGNQETVFNPQTSMNTTRILQRTAQKSVPSLSKKQWLAGVAGKTLGEDPGWFIGFTPNLIAAVVVVNDSDRSNHSKVEIDEKLSSQLFKQIIQTSIKHIRPPRTFTPPQGIFIK
ncbi:penicillin-binding protein 2A [Seinonella peptonophila]|uniref:Penicillin-binding protein 2A n=1 Tax=Seinonella peptonophila TaxID=112248 RepID=A0A1M4W5E5_9BACL|nr:transglycosylase domain-containing protein [Seinonella peptonophila]SHE76427.1 penicillin-binding protein 2A [Seinonella peptonophila]